jgi:hypothetical protein
MSKTEKHTTREGWLVEAIQELHGEFLRSYTLPKIRVACGFPAVQARSPRGRIGECHFGGCRDGALNIMIHPRLEGVLDSMPGTVDGQGVLPTLLHELGHAVLPAGVGHKAPFAKLAKAVGLEGKPKETYATGEEIRERLQAIADKLGPYPHASLNADGGKKQTTRLLKVYCPNDECPHIDEKGSPYVARVTRTRVDQGLTTCPCGTEMVCDDDYDQNTDSWLVLKTVESSVTYEVPNADGKGADPRFQVRHMMGPTGSRWSVIDFGALTKTITLANGETVEAPVIGTTQPRIVFAEDRQDALDLISSVREGLLTWDELEDDDDPDDWDDDDDSIDDLDDDEVEVEDYDDSVLTDEEYDKYEEVSEYREASGARTSEKIANQTEGALD